jgi:hypothetical protein
LTLHAAAAAAARRIAKATGVQVLPTLADTLLPSSLLHVTLYVFSPSIDMFLMTYFVLLLLLQAHRKGHWRAGGADAG